MITFPIMQGKVVVITGGSSGIGEVAAEQLAGMGARIVIVARDRERGRATLTRLQGKSPGVEHTVYYADLARIGDMKRVAGEIAAAEPKIDVLINNAGAVYEKRETTSDGLERTFATNHMSYFVLTELLRPRLLAAAPARVISTSSGAHQRAKLDFDDLQAAKSYSAFGVYSRSKLCNILFTRELARRLAGSGVTANCLHPGFVATRFGDEGKSMFSRGFKIFKQLTAITPEQGADTIVYLASSKEVATVTGEYFYKRQPTAPTKEAQDDEAASRLWKESARIAGLTD
jgi:NAD(P)-dependent dehydrogenase (short-subunit alcohol dehydrogenase family)